MNRPDHGARRLYLHSIPERLWHALHTLSVLALIVTGVNLRLPGEAPIFGLKNAVTIHGLCAKILTLDFTFWLLYILVTRRIRFFLPGRGDLVGGVSKQAKFYALGIFRGEAHPFPAKEDRKFNPLQKWIYLGVMFGMVPLLILTGIGLILPEKVDVLTGGRIHLVAIVHRLMAYFATAFVIVHVYLAATGNGLLAGFRSMVTGYVHVPIPEDAGMTGEPPESGDSPE